MNNQELWNLLYELERINKTLDAKIEQAKINQYFEKDIKELLKIRKANAETLIKVGALLDTRGRGN